MSSDPYSIELLTSEQVVSRLEQLLADHAGGFWHPGRRHGRTLYNGWGDDDGIGYMDTRPLAGLVSALRNAAPRLIEEWRTAHTEIERLLDVLHDDRSGLIAGLRAIRKRATGSLWLADGRGPYAWDDDDYQREAGWALQAIVDLIDQVTDQSGNLAHVECCGRTPRPPIQIGETPDVGRMREALLKIAGPGRQCAIHYASGPSGFNIPENGTCRDMYRDAVDHPEHYGGELRERILSKAQYCYRCTAVDALEPDDE